MIKNKHISRILIALIIIVCFVVSGINITAKAFSPYMDEKTSTPQMSLNFDGTYHEINTKTKNDILTFSLYEDVFFLTIHSLFEVVMGYSGEMTHIQPIDHGISFECVLIPTDGRDASESIPVHISLTHMSLDVYELKVSSSQNLEEPYNQILGTATYYKSDIYDNGIDGTVPAKLGEKITIAGLIKTLSPYVFEPEMMATRMYLKYYSNTNFADTEVVRQDERNRYLEYAWGSQNKCMECKYWFTDDDNILMVVNIHDATYEYPQRFRFFKFNRKEGTMRELSTALSDKWPIGAEADQQGICYQVRYSSDGIVALVPQTNGDSFDIVTLKFDGQIFR